jgi:ribosomal-protein-alanine N-acetyltransferase
MPDPTIPRLVTERLVVRPATEADAPAVLRYYIRNQKHLAGVDPLRPDAFYTQEFWQARIRQDHREIREDRSLRLFLFPREEPDRVIGIANFSNFVRGVAQHCTLGYAIDAGEEGKGLMSEGLRAGIDQIFRVAKFHRIEANYMPRNERSGALLRRLGFTIEGLAREYLFIAGHWEDHVLTSLTNPTWTEAT